MKRQRVSHGIVENAKRAGALELIFQSRRQIIRRKIREVCMKTELQSYCRFVLPPLLAVLCAFAPAAQAGWASVRASNRMQARAEAIHRADGRITERRRLDIEAERRQAYYWTGFQPGLTVSVLPAGYVQVSAAGIGYYYYDGVYFQATTTGSYAVVTPPLEVIVPDLPEGAEAVTVGPTTYYYAAGAFYIQQPNGFSIVPAPLGVTVTGLPPGAAPVVIKNVVYYLAGQNYFMPVMQAGVTVYVTAQP